LNAFCCDVSDGFCPSLQVNFGLLPHSIKLLCIFYPSFQRYAVWDIKIIFKVAQNKQNVCFEYYVAVSEITWSNCDWLVNCGFFYRGMYYIEFLSDKSRFFYPLKTHLILKENLKKKISQIHSVICGTGPRWLDNITSKFEKRSQKMSATLWL